MDYLFLILAAIAYTLSRFADLWTSQRALYYASKESNKLFRAKDGQINTTVYILASAGVGAGVVIGAVYVPELWALLALFALASFIAAALNYTSQNKARVKQTAFLQNLHVHLMAGATFSDVMPLFANLPVSSLDGQLWFPLFAWIKVPGQLGDDSVGGLMQKIADLARKDESEWFPE